MDTSLQHPEFIESVLRSYLGRYQNQFYFKKLLDDSIVLITDPPPRLAITLSSTQNGVFIVLAEWVVVDQMSEMAGVCEFEAYELESIPIEDPNGFFKMEERVAKSLLSPT